MKIEISQIPENFKETWPEQFKIFSWTEFVTAIPQAISVVTTYKENGLPNYGWKIFEWTGAAAGQEIALDLLSYIGILVIAGFGMQKNEYQLSRLMAFDADILGTWGCLPKYYPEVLKMVLDSKIQIEPFVETRPMSTIKEAYEEAHATSLMKRIVLTPDF